MKEAVITVVEDGYTVVYRVEFEGRLIEGEDDVRLTKVVATEQLKASP
jgi:hypothetical protein